MELMSLSDFEKRKKDEIKAIETLRRGLVLYIIFSILILILLITEMTAILFNDYMTNKISAFLIGFFLLIDTFSIILTTVYLRVFKEGFDRISKYINVGHVDSGIYLYAFSFSFGFVLYPFLTGGLSQIPISAFYLLSFSLGIFSLVGMILIIIGFYRIGKKYDSGSVMLGAILLIFLGFIGGLVLYSALSEVTEKVRKRVPPPPPPWIAEDGKVY